MIFIRLLPLLSVMIMMIIMVVITSHLVGDFDFAAVVVFDDYRFLVVY